MVVLNGVAISGWIESVQSWQGLHSVIEVKRQVQSQDKERTER